MIGSFNVSMKLFICTHNTFISYNLESLRFFKPDVKAELHCHVISHANGGFLGLTKRYLFAGCKIMAAGNTSAESDLRNKPRLSHRQRDG